MSVSADSLWFDTERRALLSSSYVHRQLLYIEGSARNTILHALHRQLDCNAAHVLYDGEDTFASYRLDLTTSGMPSTSYQNTVIRSFLAIVCGARRSAANGDDLLFTGGVDQDFERAFGIIPDDPTFTDGVNDAADLSSHLRTKENGRWCARSSASRF